MGFGPSSGTTLPIPLPVANTTSGTFSFSGFSTVYLTKNISGYPGGSPGEKQQPTWYNPDPNSDGGNTATWEGDTLASHSFQRHGDHHEFCAFGAVLGIPIVSTSVANPTVVTTSFAHNLKTGQTVYVFYHTGSSPTILSATPYVATVTGATTFTIPVNVATGGTGGFVCGNPSGNITFIEGSNVDAAGGSGGTAGPIVLLHTTDYGTTAGAPTINGVGGVVGAVGHVRMRIDDCAVTTGGGAHRFYDRAGNEWVSNSADGATITVGVGGTVTTFSMNAPLKMGSDKVITLDTAGTLGAANAKLQFGSATGAGLSTTTGGELLIVVNDSGSGNRTLAATFGRDESLTVIGNIISTAAFNSTGGQGFVGTGTGASSTPIAAFVGNSSSQGFYFYPSAGDGLTHLAIMPGFKDMLTGDSNGATTFPKTITAGLVAARLGGSIFEHYADVSTTSTNGTEDDLYSDTTAANTLANNGERLESFAFITTVSSATAARRIKEYFGGTLIFDSGALTLAIGSSFSIYTEIIRESSTVVRCVVSVTTTSASTVPYSTYTRITGLTLSGTNILKTTGIASGTGAASGDISAKEGWTTWMPA